MIGLSLRKCWVIRLGGRVREKIFWRELWRVWWGWVEVDGRMGGSFVVIGSRRDF